MKKYLIYPYQNDLIINNQIIDNRIKVITNIKNNKIYKTIIFKKINNNLKKSIINELLFFINKVNIKKQDHILVVGLGSINHTADSIGPNTIRHINVNAYLENLGIKIKNTKVSALIPGVLGETGILSSKTIISVTKEIKPNLIIIIDAFVTNNINYLNHTIEINNAGISPGHGITNINSYIDENALHIPIIVIGITTSVLIKFSNNNKNFIPYFLSTKDVDNYVQEISKILGDSINSAIKKIK